MGEVAVALAARFVRSDPTFRASGTLLGHVAKRSPSTSQVYLKQFYLVAGHVTVVKIKDGPF